MDGLTNLFKKSLFQKMCLKFTHIINKVLVKRTSNSHTAPYLTQMALFAAIGDRFISKILRQVASDYNLDFDEMKSRYCGESSFELSAPVKPKVQVPKPNVLEVDLEELVPAPVKVPKPKAPAKPKAPKVPKPKFTGDTEPVEPEKLMALSKMKKPELVAECDSRGLDSEGTVAQLKDRVKDAREADPAATTKGKGKTKPKADPKPKKVSLPPPPPPVPLEEEDTDIVDEEGDPDKEDPEEDEFEVEAEEDDLQARLRKILAEAEEEEFEEEEEEVEEA